MTNPHHALHREEIILLRDAVRGVCPSGCDINRLLCGNGRIIYRSPEVVDALVNQALELVELRERVL